MPCLDHDFDPWVWFDLYFWLDPDEWFDGRVESVAHQLELAVGRDERDCPVVVESRQPEKSAKSIKVFF